MQNPTAERSTKQIQSTQQTHSILCAIEALVIADNRMDDTAASIISLTQIGKKKLEKLWQ
jgi:hypothetical protein